MALERKYNLDDLYEHYAGRCPPRNVSAVEKVDLKLDKTALVRLATDDMGNIVKDYDAALKRDPKNEKRAATMLDSESRKLHTASLTENPQIRFNVIKSYALMHDDLVDDAGVYPPRRPGEEIESIIFELNSGEEEIGGYRLDRDLNPNSNAWALNDRLVLDKYRDQGFGSVLYSATESFVQQYADLHKTPQKLTANVAQPSVLVMLLNKGFVGSTEEDQRRIDMVLTAHPDLGLDYAVVKREHDQWVPQTHKDPYVFLQDTALKSEVNALRINLEKTFEPKVSPVDNTIRATRENISH